VARIGSKRNAYRILMGKPEGKRPIGRPRRRLTDNIKMDLTEIGWSGTDGSYEHDNKHSGSIKCWKISRIYAQLAASQEGLSSMKFVSLCV
jgi:hypothetical protein